MVAASSSVPGLIYSFRLRPDGSTAMPFSSAGIDDIFGATTDELLLDLRGEGRLIHPEDIGRMRASMYESARTLLPWHQEFRVRHPRRGERWILGNSVPTREADGGTLWRGYMQDITEGKRADEAIHYRNQVLAAQQEASLDGLLVVDTGFCISSMNSRFVQIWGLPQALVDGKDHKDILEFITPQFASPESFCESVRQRHQDPAEKSHVELPLKDGRIISLHSTPLLGSDGRSCGRLWTFRDITSPRQAEQALRESVDLFSTIFRVSPIAIHMFRLSDGCSILVNDAFTALTGFSREEVLGQSAVELGLFPDPQARAAMMQEMESGHAAATDVRIRTRSGELRDTLASINAVTLNGEGAAILVATDITDRKRAEAELKALEEQLLQSQKMEAVGRLAGGVAHDFNNLLQVINCYAARIAEDYASDPVLARYGRSILQSGEKAASLTRQLLAFSRKAPVEARKVELDAALRGLHDMVRRLVGEEIEVQMDLNLPGSYIEIDPTQIEQIILNLAVNARDAMPQGGRLRLVTRASLAASQTELAQVTVSDSGHGMDAETRGRVFEPFFTTKPLGQGNGLGLSTVYGIVQQGGGWIEIDSQPGAGTQIHVSFPLVEAPRTEAAPAALATSLSVSESILLVEDSEDLRSLLQDVLTDFGYRVVSAENGRAALDLIEATDESFDLVVSDAVMPVMGGLELFESLHQTRPALKLLLISGYAGGRVNRPPTLPHVDLLSKPFSMAAFGAKVRQVLQNSSTA